MPFVICLTLLLSRGIRSECAWRMVSSVGVSKKYRKTFGV